MQLLLLVGMFVCTGCGSVPYTPYLSVAAIMDYGPAHITAGWDASDKANTGNGYNVGSGGSLRFGRNWFAGPGASWSRQVTPLWTKDAVYASGTFGYRCDRGEAWLSASVPVTGKRDSRYSFGIGSQVTTASGMTFRVELQHGAYPGGGYNAMSIMGGWKWD